jgi:hypothetical protein
MFIYLKLIYALTSKFSSLLTVGCPLSPDTNFLLMSNMDVRVSNEDNIVTAINFFQLYFVILHFSVITIQLGKFTHRYDTVLNAIYMSPCVRNSP